MRVIPKFSTALSGAVLVGGFVAGNALVRSAHEAESEDAAHEQDCGSRGDLASVVLSTYHSTLETSQRLASSLECGAGAFASAARAAVGTFPELSEESGALATRFLADWALCESETRSLHLAVRAAGSATVHRSMLACAEDEAVEASRATRQAPFPAGDQPPGVHRPPPRAALQRQTAALLAYLNVVLRHDWSAGALFRRPGSLPALLELGERAPALREGLWA
ncbi:hypothetical protein H632_c1900p0, partial [Helicosporidium sp. ATCC 50920]